MNKTLISITLALAVFSVSRVVDAGTFVGYSPIARLAASSSDWLHIYSESVTHTCSGAGVDPKKFSLKLDGTEGHRQIAKLATAFYLSGTPVGFTYDCVGSSAQITYIKTDAP